MLKGAGEGAKWRDGGVHQYQIWMPSCLLCCEGSDLVGAQHVTKQGAFSEIFVDTDEHTTKIRYRGTILGPICKHHTK